MQGDSLEAADLRQLSGIIALLLDEQPGQAAAALSALRRKAAHERISGGGLKLLFERLASATVPEPMEAPRAMRGEAHRLQHELEEAVVEASRFAAENAALRHSLAQAQLRLERYDAGEMAQRRELAGTSRAAPPLPDRVGLSLGLVGGVMLTLMAMLLSHDQTGGHAARRGQPMPPAAWLPRPLADRAVEAPAAGR